eukprot:1716410-Prymnesium_polylepis.2
MSMNTATRKTCVYRRYRYRKAVRYIANQCRSGRVVGSGFTGFHALLSTVFVRRLRRGHASRGCRSYAHGRSVETNLANSRSRHAGAVARGSRTQVVQHPILKCICKFGRVRLLNVVPTCLPAETWPIALDVAVEQLHQLACSLRLYERVVACVCVEDRARQCLSIGRGTHKVVQASAVLRMQQLVRGHALRRAEQCGELKHDTKGRTQQRAPWALQ